MSKRAIKFKVSDNTMVYVGGIKAVLDGMVGLGVGGAALNTNTQLLPWVTFGCFTLRLFLSYLFKAWVEQSIDVEDSRGQ